MNGNVHFQIKVFFVGGRGGGDGGERKRERERKKGQYDIVPSSKTNVHCRWARYTSLWDLEKLNNHGRDSTTGVWTQQQVHAILLMHKLVMVM